MMRVLLAFGMLLSILACGGKKKAVISSNTSIAAKKSETDKPEIQLDREEIPSKIKEKKTAAYKKIDAILDYAKTFKGTKYRYAGTTKKGMDCSGLVYVSYLKEGVELPRTSRSMATKGIKINPNKAQNGDLIFFKTTRKNTISHVGIIVNPSKPIRFIHASTSKGVIISSLDESYWNKAFAQVRRVL